MAAAAGTVGTTPSSRRDLGRRGGESPGELAVLPEDGTGDLEPGNNPPVAQPDSKTVMEESYLLIQTADLLANDTDPDGDSLTVIAIDIAESAGYAELVGEVIVYAAADHFRGIDQFTYTVSDGRGGQSTATVSITVEPWAQGAKSVLVIRLDFSDLPGEPFTEELALSRMTEVDAFYQSVSYGLLSFPDVTVTPTMRLPHTRQFYRDSGDYRGLRDDAHIVAEAAGYDPYSYFTDIVAFSQTFTDFSALGAVRNRGVWMNGTFYTDTLAHELGHNLGAYHSNAWIPAGEDPIGPGTSAEYGNDFDLMGLGRLQPPNVYCRMARRGDSGGQGNLERDLPHPRLRRRLGRFPRPIRPGRPRRRGARVLARFPCQRRWQSVVDRERDRQPGPLPR